MSWYRRSENIELILPVQASAQRMASVIYDGPAVQAVAVLWSIRCRALVTSGLRSYELGLVVGVDSVGFVGWNLNLRRQVLGQFVSLGGCLVMDLEPGDVMFFCGASASANSLALLGNGLDVVVL